MAQSNEQDATSDELDFDEAEYALNNRIRITLEVESYKTEVHTNLGWMPVVDYVKALIKQHELDARQGEVESMGVLVVDIPELLPLLAKRLDQLKAEREGL